MSEREFSEKKYLRGMRPWHYLSILKNPIDFAIRNRVRWNLPVTKKENVLFSSIVSNYDSTVKCGAQRLIDDYHLDTIQFPFHQALGEVNLYYLDLFQTAFQEIDISINQHIRAVDVGPSDWFYLPALVSFLRFFQNAGGRTIDLEGYEIDPYRVYDNFHARHNIASQRTAAFDVVRYHLQSFSPQEEFYDLVLQCFPFLFLKDHLSWGLPRSLFAPGKLLMNVTSSLKRNGILLIINQGIDEHLFQKELLGRTKLNILKDFKFTSDYKEYDHEHFVLVAKK